MENAIKKINDEMQKQPDNQCLEIIGQYIIDRCSSQEDADKVNKDDKSLSGAFKAIEEFARKKATAGCAVIKDNDIFDAIDEYFGFSVNEEIRRKTKYEIDGGAVQKPNHPKINLNFENLI